jgi:flagellar assembly protein FliH
MGSAPAKFLFDNDFAAGGRTSKPTISLADHAAKVAEAEMTAHARGFAEAQASAEQKAAVTLDRIAGLLQGLDRSLAAVEARLETEAVEVAVAVARKLVPALLEREPLAEITTLASDCFRHLVASPHVAVRVNEALHASARERLEEIIRRLGLESRLVVLGEPEIAPGDCRIEWADGGICRDSAALTAAIDQAVKRYISARLEAAPKSDIVWRLINE